MTFRWSDPNSSPALANPALLHKLQAFSRLQRCTKRALLSHIRKLAFAVKVIPAGRAFIRRLIDTSTHAQSLHRHVRLSSGGTSGHIFTDASDIGYGAYWAGHWLSGSWSPCQRQHDIQWRELYAITVAATAWGARWARKRLFIHCDNQAVVHVWPAGTTKHRSLMSLVRALFYVAASHNFTVLLQHISGVDNGTADALSRLQFHRFRSLAPRYFCAHVSRSLSYGTLSIYLARIDQTSPPPPRPGRPPGSQAPPSLSLQGD